jgi:hypothetical protein
LPSMSFTHSFDTLAPNVIFLAAGVDIPTLSNAQAVNQLDENCWSKPTSASKLVTSIDMAPTKKPRKNRRPCENRPSPQEWLNVKDGIEKLYVAERHNLGYVARVLKHRHDFVATLRMFKSRIKEWNFNRKTIRRPEWQFMLQEYVQRKNQSTPKETTFRISQDNHGQVTKYKTIRDIRKYFRRIHVSEEDFLLSLSDRDSFPHIQSITPPSSPAISPVSASPASQIDANNTDAATLASLMDISGASLSLQNPTTDVCEQYACSQDVDWPFGLDEISIEQCDVYSLFPGASNGPQEPAHLSGWPWEDLTA